MMVHSMCELKWVCMFMVQPHIIFHYFFSRNITVVNGVSCCAYWLNSVFCVYYDTAFTSLLDVVFVLVMKQLAGVHWTTVILTSASLAHCLRVLLPQSQHVRQFHRASCHLLQEMPLMFLVLPSHRQQLILPSWMTC